VQAAGVRLETAGAYEVTTRSDAEKPTMSAINNPNPNPQYLSRLWCKSPSGIVHVIIGFAQAQQDLGKWSKKARYQVEQGTFTPKRSDMFGTPNKRRPSAVAPSPAMGSVTG
jgi:hypothetical protein